MKSGSNANAAKHRMTNPTATGAFYCRLHGKDKKHNARDCKTSLNNPNATLETNRSRSNANHSRSNNQKNNNFSPTSFRKELNLMEFSSMSLNDRGKTLDGYATMINSERKKLSVAKNKKDKKRLEQRLIRNR